MKEILAYRDQLQAKLDAVNKVIADMGGSVPSTPVPQAPTSPTNGRRKKDGRKGRTREEKCLKAKNEHFHWRLRDVGKRQGRLVRRLFRKLLSIVVDRPHVYLWGIFSSTFSEQIEKKMSR
jgi:hypothetical protein